MTDINIEEVEHASVFRNGPPIWKHLLWGAVALAFLWALSKIPSTLIVFSLAWLIAYLLNPAVDGLCGKRIGPIKACTRGQAVGIVTVLLLGALTAAGAMVLPQLAEQVDHLVDVQTTLGDPAELPAKLQEKIEPYLARIPDAYREDLMTKASTIVQDSASKLGSWASMMVKWLGSFLGQFLSAIFLVCSAFLVSIYMLLNWHGMGASFLEKLPQQYQKEVRSLSFKMNEIFGGYLKATILTSLACMAATFISLLILGWTTGRHFPYMIIVSFVAGLTYPIPVIGIIATSILGGVLGFVAENNLGYGIGVLVMINVVNIIIDRTVQPRLMSGAIGVSELFVMFAAFAGGEIAGVWGMLLGIPVAAMGKALFEWFHLNFLLVDEQHEREMEIISTGQAASEFVEPPPASVGSLPPPTSEDNETPTVTDPSCTSNTVVVVEPAPKVPAVPEPSSQSAVAAESAPSAAGVPEDVSSSQAETLEVSKSRGAAEEASTSPPKKKKRPPKK